MEKVLWSVDSLRTIQRSSSLVSVPQPETPGNNKVDCILISREGETHGKQYYFRSYDEFQEKIKNDEFLEHVEYNKKCYGTEEQKVMDVQKKGKICILEIELKGSKKVHQRRPEWNCIFIYPPSEEDLVKRYKKRFSNLRLEGRGTETKDVIANRVKIGVDEIREAKTLDYFVKTFVNDDFEKFYGEFKEFLQSMYINQKF